MAAAFFALAGTLLGIVGTLALELNRTRAADIRSHRKALQRACADFTAAVSSTRKLAVELMYNPDDTNRLIAIRDTERVARGHYERLRLIARSLEVQRAGRHVARYAYGLVLQVEGKGPRSDEREKGVFLTLHEWTIILYVEVRRELGIRNPDVVYREPDAWVGPPFDFAES